MFQPFKLQGPFFNLLHTINIIVASAQAYINALNRLYAALQHHEERMSPQHSNLETASGLPT